MYNIPEDKKQSTVRPASSDLQILETWSIMQPAVKDQIIGVNPISMKWLIISSMLKFYINLYDWIKTMYP